MKLYVLKLFIGTLLAISISGIGQFSRESIPHWLPKKIFKHFLEGD
jgi:hypothetical protein